MLLGQTDRAVQLLLETDSDNDNYYVDCLRYLTQFSSLIFMSCPHENKLNFIGILIWQRENIVTYQLKFMILCENTKFTKTLIPQ